MRGGARPHGDSSKAIRQPEGLSTYLALVCPTHALKPLKALVDECFHQSLVRHSPPGCYILGPTEQVLRNPQRDLRRGLIERLEHFSLEFVVAQFVEWVVERFPG